MDKPQEVDLAILKRAMFDVINEYTPSSSGFNSSSDDLEESNKELAQFIISELTPKLQNALDQALNTNMDFNTFARLHNIKMIVSED